MKTKRDVNSSVVVDMIELSRILAEFGQIKRVTLMPNGDFETDSHHSFSLALVAYELASEYASELNLEKILLYSLVHDLVELINGDMQTLTASTEDLENKAKQDAVDLLEVKQRLKMAPRIIEALEKYEAKEDDEALFVYWLDKVVTIPTHFYDQGANLKALGVNNQQDIREWYKRTLAKLSKQSNSPHPSVAKVLELAYQKMHDELLEP